MEVLNQTRRRNLQTPERRRRSRDAHRAILAAIEAGDAEAAERAMTDHIRGVASLVMGSDDAGQSRVETTGEDDD
jgi:DNA-binding GntR family transcriptional regulator